MYSLRDIPATMRGEGWSVGAALMDRWLGAPPYAMTLDVKTGDAPAPAQNLDDSTVTMKWATGFSRAATAQQRLNTTWSTAPRYELSRQQVEKQVRRWITSRRVDKSKPFRFGDLRQPVATVNAESAINIEVVDSPVYGPVDDFYAALGRALFKIAVSGTVTPQGQGWRIEIDETATFLRDTYDFLGDQPLGSWGPGGFSRFAVLASQIEVDPNADVSVWYQAHDYYTVSNADFRRYRGVIGRGGDFVVLSDLSTRRLGTPVVMTLGGL